MLQPALVRIGTTSAVKLTARSGGTIEAARAGAAKGASGRMASMTARSHLPTRAADEGMPADGDPRGRDGAECRASLRYGAMGCSRGPGLPTGQEKPGAVVIPRGNPTFFRGEGPPGTHPHPSIDHGGQDCGVPHPEGTMLFKRGISPPLRGSEPTSSTPGNDHRQTDGKEAPLTLTVWA